MAALVSGSSNLVHCSTPPKELELTRGDVKDVAYCITLRATSAANLPQCRSCMAVAASFLVGTFNHAHQDPTSRSPSLLAWTELFANAGCPAPWIASMFRVMIRGYSMLLFFSKPSLRASTSHQAPQGFVLLMDRVINDTTAKPDF
ncbi:hypothetical protein KCU81_g100, partial [Aureobasidium melanogenum]